jgi:hypothetical protein
MTLASMPTFTTTMFDLAKYLQDRRPIRSMVIDQEQRVL